MAVYRVIYILGKHLYDIMDYIHPKNAVAI